MDLQLLKRIDPVRKQSERGPAHPQGLSPLDPPDAYSPPNLEQVSAEAMHPFLRQLRDEHVRFLHELNVFEEAIRAIQEQGYSRDADAKLRAFFSYFDQEFVAHSRREEAILFPLLHLRLVASGEHGKGSVPVTATDVMENEHLKAVQLAAVVVNFLGLVFRLPDERSALTVLDAALEQGKILLEMLRLHVFREDNVVFPLAHRLINASEFDAMQSKETFAPDAP